MRTLRQTVTRIWRWTGGNHEQIKIAFAIVAALFVMFEYYGKVKEAKVTKVLHYVTEFRQGELGVASQKLRAFWDGLTPEEWKKQVGPPQNFDQKISALMKADKELIGSLQAHESFFSELALCVKGNNCHQETVCNFFFDKLQEFRHNYRWRLEELKAWKDSAPSLVEELTEKGCKKEHQNYCNIQKTSPYCLRK